MLKTVVFLTLRRLARDKLFAAINLLGLALAFSCGLILALYVSDELSYDKHHKRYDQVYRIVNLLNNNGFVEDFSRVPPPLGPLLKQDFPEVKDYARFRPAGDEYLIRRDNTALYWDNIYFADPSAFSLFTHTIIEGNPGDALSDPLSIAVSQSFARAYVGEASALGKTVSTETADYRISLVFADLPKNSHLRYDALFSYQRLGMPSLSSADGLNSLGSTSDYTYLLMPENYHYQNFSTTIGEAFWQHYLAERVGDNSHTQYYLEPLTDIHLHSTTLADLRRGSWFAVQCFVAIIVFLLVVAVINYINLSTAFGAKRINQNIMKRLLGENRSSILLQSIFESFVLVCGAFVLGIVLTELILSLLPINQLLNKNLTLTTFLQPKNVVALTGFALLIAVFCGLFPAIGLIRNGDLPIRSMRLSNNSPYRLITIFIQFTLTVAVIALSLVMYAQIRFLLQESWGFEKNNRLITQIRGANFVERYPTFRDRLLEHPNISAVTSSSGRLGHDASVVILGIEANDGAIATETMHTYRVSEDYIETMGMELSLGRSFDPAIAADRRQAALVNQAAVRTMGWDRAIGKRIGNFYADETATVIGVVKDFHLYDFGRPIEPLALFFDDAAYEGASPNVRARASRTVTIRYDGDPAVAIGHLEQLWNEFSPVHPFHYQYLDESIDQLYAPYQHQMSAVVAFAIVAIFIACLGLFGLTVFVTQQRTKEIGIRKVLGASSKQIVLLFFKPIFVMIATAAIFASIMGYIAVQQWLQSFAYRIDLTVLPFLLATGITVVIALLTVGFQSNKTAQQNPVDSLRYE